MIEDDFVNPELSINEQSGQYQDSTPSDRRKKFFNKRNTSSNFNELKIMIDDSKLTVKPQTSNADSKP